MRDLKKKKNISVSRLIYRIFNLKREQNPSRKHVIEKVLNMRLKMQHSYDLEGGPNGLANKEVRRRIFPRAH